MICFRRLRTVCVLIIAFGLAGLVSASTAFSAGSKIKIIPAYFGQNQDAKNWFTYQAKPGEVVDIKATVINLTPDDLKVQVGVVNWQAFDPKLSKLNSETNILGRRVEWLQANLPAKGRQTISLKINSLPDDSEQEYSGWLVVRMDDQIIEASRLRLKLGSNLPVEFAVDEVALEAGRDQVQLRFRLTNKGRASLSGVRVRVGYRNRWWLSGEQEEVFVIREVIEPGKSIEVKRSLLPPHGLFGPVSGQLIVSAAEKTRSVDVSFNWLAVRRLMMLLGYLLVFGVGAVLSLRYIFKGAAGILLAYIRQKLNRSQGQPSADSQSQVYEESRLEDLLKTSGLDYNRLLLDIRQIVREEMILNRKLLLAEIDKSAAAGMVKLLKKGGVKITKAGRPKTKAKLNKLNN